MSWHPHCVPVNICMHLSKYITFKTRNKTAQAHLAWIENNMEYICIVIHATMGRAINYQCFVLWIQRNATTNQSYVKKKIHSISLYILMRIFSFKPKRRWLWLHACIKWNIRIVLKVRLRSTLDCKKIRL